MDLFKEFGVKDPQAAAAQIPVIDFAPLFAGELRALSRLAPQVRHACENVGFFYAAGHCVSEELIDRAFAASRRFHALPLDEKLKLSLNENNIGYLPVGASVQGASTVHKATRPNRNESFFVSHDRGPDHPDVLAGKPLRGRNQWPPETIPGVSEMRRDMMAYFHALGAMCDRMLPAFAAALDMPPDFFAPYFANEAHANLRFLHYPPQDANEENLFGQAPHTDNSFMTALARTDVPGLAVRLPSGRVVSAADHPRHIPDQSRQHHAALVERPLSVDAARCLERQRRRPLFDRLFPQPEPGQRHRVPAELRLGAQPPALRAGHLSRPRARILSRKLLPPEGPQIRRRGGGAGCRVASPIVNIRHSGRTLTCQAHLNSSSI